MSNELVEREFEESGVPVEITRVASELAFQSAIKDHSFDMVISDTRLPGFDTLNALTIIRQSNPRTPFVFFTGNGDPNFREQTFKRGATDYISKNDLPRLVEFVRRRCAINQTRPSCRTVAHSY